jgi:hypothetical protein
MDERPVASGSGHRRVISKSLPVPGRWVDQTETSAVDEWSSFLQSEVGSSQYWADGRLIPPLFLSSHPLRSSQRSSSISSALPHSLIPVLLVWEVRKVSGQDQHPTDERNWDA